MTKSPFRNRFPPAHADGVTDGDFIWVAIAQQAATKDGLILVMEKQAIS
jgi:hypothetical protein